MIENDINLLKSNIMLLEKELNELKELYYNLFRHVEVLQTEIKILKDGGNI